MGPEVAATGHGIPMHGENLRSQLTVVASRFDAVARPKTGRYVQQPATADASGVTSVPPPAGKPWLKVAVVAGLALGAVALAGAGRKKRKGKSNSRQKGFKSRAERKRYRNGTNATGDQRYSDSESRKIEAQYPG